MAGARVAEGPDSPALREILASAALPNIHVKLSGFHYVDTVAWEYPYPRCRSIVQALYERVRARATALGLGLPGRAQRDDVPAGTRSRPHPLRLHQPGGPATGSSGTACTSYCNGTAHPDPDGAL